MNNDYSELVEIGNAAEVILGKGGANGDDGTQDLGSDALED